MPADETVNDDLTIGTYYDPTKSDAYNAFINDIRQNWHEATNQSAMRWWYRQIRARRQNHQHRLDNRRLRYWRMTHGKHTRRARGG